MPFWISDRGKSWMIQIIHTSPTWGVPWEALIVILVIILGQDRSVLFESEKSWEKSWDNSFEKSFNWEQIPWYP